LRKYMFGVLPIEIASTLNVSFEKKRKRRMQFTHR